MELQIGDAVAVTAEDQAGRARQRSRNGVPANGGSLDGPRPVVVGGMVFVNSGYSFVGGMPGKVLLAFSIDGK